MNSEGCLFILDESSGLLEQYSGRTNIIKLEHCAMGLPKATALQFPLKIAVDPPTTQYVEVKIKLEKPLQNQNSGFSVRKRKTKTKKSGPSVECDVCGKEFVRSRIARHRQIHNEQRERLQCDQCPQTCSDKWTLARHQTIHNGNKPYVCPVCEKGFANSTGLKRHLTCHDPDSRPFECTQCPKRFPDRSSLKKHLLLHSGLRPHVCEVCEKAFTVIGDLNLHKKCHQEVKPYSCQTCGRQFTRQNNLLRHQSVHIISGSDVYKCDVCNVTFQHGGTLTRHIIAAHPVKKRIVDKSARFQDEEPPKGSQQG